MDYKRELLFLEEKVKPIILTEGVGDGFFITSINDNTVMFNFFFLMDYLPFRRFEYKNNKFYDLKGNEYIKMNEDFLNYLSEHRDQKIDELFN